MPPRPPRRLSLLLFAALPACASSGAGDPTGGAGGKADDPVGAPFGLDERPENATCLAPPRPPSGSSVALQRAFDGVAFTQPTAMVQAPGSSRWYVVEKRGVVFSMPDDDDVTPSDVGVVLDHRSEVESNPNEAGLLGLAFHPDFTQNGRVFLSYTVASQGSLFSVITEMQSNDGGDTFDPSTEEIVLFVEQPFLNHNGGHIAFGPDGLLYAGYGDGGDAGDPHENGQDTGSRLGALLRIDVDSGDPFGIPPDNPFADGEGGLPEIYAYGLRNPWRFSFDRGTGDLWRADVGQDEWEEVNVIEAGGNYGWNLKEADACFAAAFPCDDLGLIDPVASYDHAQNDISITGGYVYRGDAIPSLVGSYVYGDFVSGRIWGLFPDTEDGGFEPQLLVESGVNLASFAQAHDGELYAVAFGGTIHRLVSAGGVVDEFPQRLSDTGCFDPDDPAEPAEGLIPYNVNMPLWSDGADKERYLALPPGEQIQVGADGDFDLPIGTVLVKTFWLEGRRVETRLLVRHDDGGWGGYAFEWNEAQTEAELLQGGKTVEVEGQSWRIPSRGDCSACHTQAAGRSLGLEIAQLNGEHVYPSTNRSSNQLATFDHIDLFAELSDVDPEALPAFPRLGAGAPAEEVARAYLHANCAHCHRPGGPGLSDADLRFDTPLAEAGLCGAPPVSGSLGLAGASLVAPGDPDLSIVSRRMRAEGPERMPPIATRLVHQEGVTAIDAWIASLTSCP